MQCWAPGRQKDERGWGWGHGDILRIAAVAAADCCVGGDVAAHAESTLVETGYAERGGDHCSCERVRVLSPEGGLRVVAHNSHTARRLQEGARPG